MKAVRKRSWKGSVGTVTKHPDVDAVISGLAADDWSTVLAAIASAQQWIAGAVGATRLQDVVDQLVVHANHPKWEVRRAVAQAAGESLHAGFATALVKLTADTHAQVRKAAGLATRKRRDRAKTSALGEQHANRLDALLGEIEARFGVLGRDAVKRVGEEIAETFARELHHEVIRLLTPLSVSADRLVEGLSALDDAPSNLVASAERMKVRVAHLTAVMRAMRSYSAQPALVFTNETLQQVLDESLGIVGDQTGLHINAEVEQGLRADICRPRLVQALTNLVANAVESYDGRPADVPILIRAISEQQRIVITIADGGCGMSHEVLGDVRRLFTTSKENGTGVGIPMVVKIVESEHDGTLEIESSKDRGTTVRVMFPIRYQRAPT